MNERRAKGLLGSQEIVRLATKAQIVDRALAANCVRVHVVKLDRAARTSATELVFVGTPAVIPLENRALDGVWNTAGAAFVNALTGMLGLGKALLFDVFDQERESFYHDLFEVTPGQ